MGVEKEGWDVFLTWCQHTENRDVLSELFDLLLTPEEKSSLETRCLIIKELLESQKPQRKISEDLHVSIAKITRGSNELKRVSPRLRTHVEKLLLAHK